VDAVMWTGQEAMGRSFPFGRPPFTGSPGLGVRRKDKKRNELFRSMFAMARGYVSTVVSL